MTAVANIASQIRFKKDENYLSYSQMRKVDEYGLLLCQL